MNRLKTFAVILVAFISFAAVSMAADAPYALNLDVKEFFLENGMQFLVVERHTVPQVACRVAIRAGSALEDTGKTGIAHMLEHMMFKGTKNFGTLDWKRDQALQQEIEAAYQVVLKEELKRDPDQALIREKVQEMERLRLEVQKLYVPQAFSMQVGMNGAVNVNAFTNTDQTQYLMSVPSDMIEQWFSIVSEQIFEPAWREFTSTTLMARLGSTSWPQATRHILTGIRSLAGNRTSTCSAKRPHPPFTGSITIPPMPSASWLEISPWSAQRPLPPSISIDTRQAPAPPNA
jgi:hypothetical protein